MGRKKKIVEYDAKRFSRMPREEKLKIFEDFNQLFHYELDSIPSSELTLHGREKAEDLAQKYYESKGYEVYRSRVRGGYRAIGVEFYWRDHAAKLNRADWDIVSRLKQVLGNEGFRELAFLVKDKSGTPDLLLIKDERVSFVEVKANYETVKFPTVHFWLKYGERWPTSILRVQKH